MTFGIKLTPSSLVNTGCPFILEYVLYASEKGHVQINTLGLDRLHRSYYDEGLADTSAQTRNKIFRRGQLSLLVLQAPLKLGVQAKPYARLGNAADQSRCKAAIQTQEPVILDRPSQTWKSPAKQKALVKEEQR